MRWAGPAVALPSTLKALRWHLQYRSSGRFCTTQPLCVQTDEEAYVISSVDTTVTPHQIQLVSGPKNDHASGQTVVILPQTLLRAIRTVQIDFDAITPKKDYDAATAGAAVGRAGHAGTRGLEYRVRPFERSVDVDSPRRSVPGAGQDAGGRH